jgi:integrase
LVHKETNKNASSARTVPIMAQLREALAAAPEHKPDDYVVSLSQQGIYIRVNTVCRRLGLPEIGVHGLRHSFASLAYHLDVPYRVTMEIGGWSDDATVRKIYTHIAQEAVRDGADAFRAFYERKNE